MNDRVSIVLALIVVVAIATSTAHFVTPDTRPKDNLSGYVIIEIRGEDLSNHTIASDALFPTYGHAADWIKTYGASRKTYWIAGRCGNSPIPGGHIEPLSFTPENPTQAEALH